MSPGHTTIEHPPYAPMYTDGDTFNPAWWGPTHGNSGNSSLYSTAERTLSTSATVLDNVIPIVYGTRKVTGLCGARRVTSSGGNVYLAFVFSFGEQASITNIQINDEDIDDLPWILDYESAVGDGATDLSELFTYIAGWAAADTALWKTLCNVIIKIDSYGAQMPSALKVTATLGGALIDTTWRTGGSEADSASADPVDIAHHILTSSSIWRGVESTRIHTASWQDVANWCAEDPGDATARWSFNGIIQNRDPDAAMAEVLAHCFATPYMDMDGKIRLWAEMPPPPITGDWSCDGTTVTEDASAGAADTELAANDVVYVGSSLRTVASITSADEFELTATATETAAKVREISGVQVYKHNWLGTLEGGEFNKNETPDKIVVRWTDPDEWGNREYTSTYGSPDPNHYRRTEVTCSGCTNASMAARIGSHHLRTALIQPYYWTGVADGTVADLEPGDVFQISDDVLTSTTVRLLPPKGVLTNGAYQLSMREFDIGVYTDVTASPATGATPGGGWTTGVPDAPTAASQIFGYSGDWDSNGHQAWDPDDMTTPPAGWPHGAVFAKDIDKTYNGTVDATELYLMDSAGADGYGIIGLTVPYTDTAFDYDRYLMSAMFKFKANNDANCTWTFFYGTGASTASITVHWSSEIDPPTDGEWIRIWGVFPIQTLVSGNHYIGIRADYDGTPPSSSEETIYVKRFVLLPLESDLGLSLYERWEWTEHASAGDTVQSYQVYVEPPSGIPIVVYSVPQGTSELEFPVIAGGLMPGGYINVRSGYYDYDMRALGINGAVADFPAPTQSVEVRNAAPIVRQSRDTTQVLFDFSTAGADNQFYGWLEGVGAVSTTELPNDRDWCFYRGSIAGTYWLAINYEGEIEKVELSVSPSGGSGLTSPQVLARGLGA